MRNRCYLVAVKNISNRSWQTVNRRATLFCACTVSTAQGNSVVLCLNEASGVASPKCLGDKNLTLGEQQYFCLERPFSKHKMTRYAKSLGCMPPYAHPQLRLCCEHSVDTTFTASHVN